MTRKFLSEKVVLITGASSGIGHALALLCAKHGAKVVLAARRKARLDKLHDEIDHLGGEALVVKTDVTDPDDISHLVYDAIDHYGRIDYLINNAGFGMVGAIQHTPLVELKHIFDVNVFGLHALTSAVIPHMLEQGSGHIINIASVVGLVTFPKNGPYCATKHAVIAYSDALRMELAPKGIQVSAICPGPVRTEFMESATKVEDRRFSEDQPGFLWQTPEEIARIILGCMLRPRRRILTSFPVRVMVFFATHFPGTYQWMMQKMGDKLMFEE